MGRRAVVGINDLSTVNPEVAAQWHPTKNGMLTPEDILPFSNKKVWWICKFNHEWDETPSNRAKGCGCPYCSGRRVIIGVNDLETVNPEIAAQWHPTKNGELTPRDVQAGSRRSIWWTCEEGHEWKCVVNNRSNGSGCPKCYRSPVKGVNDLETVNPELAAQWHPTKNGALTPQDVTRGSRLKAHWICKKDHEWSAIINHRSNGSACPICSFKAQTEALLRGGKNTLSAVNPKLAEQWHPTKNGELTPQRVAPKSTKRVWWICVSFHEWEATIINRFNGTGCPKCSVRVTEESFRAAFDQMSAFDFEAAQIRLFRPTRKRNRAQIDMLNDDLKLVVEYDGAWAHGANGPERKTLEQKLAEDKETTQALVDIGYNVIRIREHDRKQKLLFVPLDSEYEFNVFQITYKSFGKNKDDITEIAKKIIEEKKDWFKTSNKVASTVVC